MKPTDENIGISGDKQMALYAKIEKPLRVKNREALTAFFLEDAEYKRLYDEINQRGVEYRAKYEAANKKFTDFMEQWRKDHPTATRKDARNAPGFVEARDAARRVIEQWERLNDETTQKAKERMTAVLREQGYDGVILEQDKGSFGRATNAYIALDNTQIKSATDNIGTFDSENPDIRWQRFDATDDDTATEAQGRRAAYDRLQNENAVLRETVAAVKKLNAKQGKTIEALQKRLHITKTPETRLGDARKRIFSVDLHGKI